MPPLLTRSKNRSPMYEKTLIFYRHDYVVCGRSTIQRMKAWFAAGDRVGTTCSVKLDHSGDVMFGPGLFSRQGADGVTMCVHIPSDCIRAPAAVLPAAQLPLIAAAAGESHVCLLDRHGALYCHGAHNACQYMRQGRNGTGWQPAYLPWPRAESLVVAGNITCIGTAHSVFCTGCTRAGCLCRTAATLNSAAGVRSVTVTPSSYCIVTDTTVCKGIPSAPAATRCMVRDSSVLCGNQRTPVRHALSVTASATMVVVTTDTGMCASTDNMDTITCA